MLCPRCNSENPDDARFCGECGSEIVALEACPDCGHDVPPGTKFCFGCGRQRHGPGSTAPEPRERGRGRRKTNLVGSALKEIAKAARNPPRKGERANWIERLIADRLRAQGIDPRALLTSIDAVASAVTKERPDLRLHAAPDGTVTILFTDIVDSTPTADRLGDKRFMELLRVHKEIIRRHVTAAGGYEVKNYGDGFMIAFSSARRALQSAVAIQRDFAARNAKHPDEPIRVRIGLHTGETFREEGDFFGKNVILASRIADEAKGGEILVSDLLRQLTDSAGEFVFDDGREVELKGLAERQRVYSIRVTPSLDRGPAEAGT